MTGYVETLTDPSYRGQILVTTYPLVGNYGVPRRARPGASTGRYESTGSRCRAWWCRALRRRATAITPRRARSAQWLASEGVPAMTGIDTRTLTRRLREQRHDARLAVPGEIELDARQAHGATRSTCGRRSSAWSRRRSRSSYRGGDSKILLVDAGAKDNIVRSLLERGATVIRAPWHARPRGAGARAPTAS